MSHLSLKTLSSLRMLVGASCLLIPRQAGALFGVPLAAGPESVFFVRMAGIRDIVLGAYLWKRVGDTTKMKMGGSEGAGDVVRKPLINKAAVSAEGGGIPVPGMTRASQENLVQADEGATTTAIRQTHATSTLSSAVWLGLTCDLVDFTSVAICWLEGNPLSGLAEVTVGGGALMFAAIGGQYLWVSRRG